MFESLGHNDCRFVSQAGCAQLYFVHCNGALHDCCVCYVVVLQLNATGLHCQVGNCRPATLLFLLNTAPSYRCAASFLHSVVGVASVNEAIGAQLFAFFLTAHNSQVLVVTGVWATRCRHTATTTMAVTTWRQLTTATGTGTVATRRRR